MAKVVRRLDFRTDRAFYLGARRAARRIVPATPGYNCKLTTFLGTVTLATAELLQYESR